MTIKLKKNDNIYVIELDGELDLYSTYKVKTLYTKMAEKGIRSIILDLENLGYLDSSGLGSIIYIFSNLKKLGGKMSICHLNGSPKNLIQMTRLDKLFLIADTLEDSANQVK